MKNKSKILIIALAMFSVNAFADGAALYTAKICNTCHGVDGKTPLLPQYPSIVGQSKEYTIQQMTDIKEGKRTNGMSAVMAAVMTTVTPDDIKEIAEWLSTQGEEAKEPAKEEAKEPAKEPAKEEAKK